MKEELSAERRKQLPPKKPCTACKSEIPLGASLCPVCKSYQRGWKNSLQYCAGIATLIALTVSAIFWLYERIHGTFFYSESVKVVECSTIAPVVIVNRGDRDAFVTQLLLWMPNRTKDWSMPILQINQLLAPGQFYKA